MSAGHEQAWSDALAQEHLHQRELLATLRGELGTFARECASALTALDAYVGLAGVTEILTGAQTSVAHARLALEVGRRVHRGEDPELVDLYTAVAGDEDVPPAWFATRATWSPPAPSGQTGSCSRPSSPLPARAHRSSSSSAPRPQPRSRH
jgi:hypothetical protein